MDIKTKFDIGDTVVFLMAEEGNLTSVHVVEGQISHIQIEKDISGSVIITYTVNDENGSEIEFEECELSFNHKELVQKLFEKNMRVFPSGKHRPNKSDIRIYPEFMEELLTQWDMEQYTWTRTDGTGPPEELPF